MNERQRIPPLRFAVLGFGKIARTRAIPALLESASARLSAIATRGVSDFDPCHVAARVEAEVVTYEEVVARGRELSDAAYIALPNDMHIIWAQRCLAAGLHVLCEKPLTPDLNEARMLRTMASTHGVLLAEGFMYRLDPRHSRVRALIQEGAIGRPRLFEAHFSYVLTDTNNIRLSADRMGGALMDVGCYGIDAARLVFATEPTEVAAHSTVVEASGIDELTALTLRFANEQMATITASTRLCRRHEYRVHGETGSIIVPDSFVPVDGNETEVRIVSDSGTITTERFPPRIAFREEIEHVAKAFRTGQDSLLAPLEDGVAMARALAAARASAASARAVSCEPAG